MFGWLKKKIDTGAENAFSKDLDTMIRVCRKMSDIDIGEAVFAATLTRVGLLKTPTATIVAEFPYHPNGIPDSAWGIHSSEEENNLYIPVVLAKWIIENQKNGNYSTASGINILYHTCRSVQFPGLEPKLKIFWLELSRGFDTAETLANEIDEIDIQPHEFRFIPEGLKSI